MSRNRKKNANTVQVASLAKWIVLAFFMGVAGLCFVYFKNQLHSTGTQVKALERELEELVQQNEVETAKIALLSSRSVLQRKLEQGLIKMVDISNERIVRVNAQPLNRDYAGIRPVSNEGMER